MSQKKSARIFPLRRGFRFIHEPVHYHEHRKFGMFVGRERELDELSQRIIYSNGGSFLITGYRGVGKTSFVNHTIEHIKGLASGSHKSIEPLRILNIHLNLARPLTPSELMYHMLRSLYQELEEQNLLRWVDAHTRKALVLATQRTSMNITRSNEKSGEIGYDLSKLITSFQALSVLSGKVTRSQKNDLSYLAYDEKSAEYDLIRIAKRLILKYKERQGLFRKKQLKVIFIFDEIDKLENSTAPNGNFVIDDILGTLKNLFTTSGMFFIFIAGRDLHERLTEDVNRGDSIYESVFTYSTYLPAMWADVDAICGELVILEESSSTKTQIAPSEFDFDLNAFKLFLAYKGRGIPRRILRSFNQFVGLNGGELALMLDKQDLRRVRFFAKLQEVLTQEDERLVKYIHEEVRGERRDKRLLSIYYLVDWVLQQVNRSFSLVQAQAVAVQLSAKIAPDALVAEEIVKATIDVLLAREYLEKEDEVSVKQLANQTGGQAVHYRISRRRLLEMGDAEEENDDQAPLSDESELPFEIPGYTITKLAATGGFARIYRAKRKQNSQDVAVKVCEITHNEAALLLQFAREVDLLRRVKHENIVSLIESGEFERFRYFSMPFIDGITLRELISAGKPVDFDTAMSIMKPIIAAHSYLHGIGIVRTDVKPGNIMIDQKGHVWLLDLGIAVNKTDDAKDVLIAGTPDYAAPEHLSGASFDARVDVFPLGRVLYELLSGDTDFKWRHFTTDKYKEELSKRLLRVSRRVRKIIERCLQLDPEQRFVDAKELFDALPPSKAVDLREVVIRVQDYNRKVAVYEDEGTLENPTGYINKADPLTSQVPQLQINNTDTSQTNIISGNEEGPTVQVVDDYDGPILRGLNIELSGVKDDKGYYYRLEQGKQHRIGRSIENEIILNGAKVSRYHAVIRWNNGENVLEDLNSSHGTLLNEVLVRNPTTLSPGDVISIGGLDLIFETHRKSVIRAESSPKTSN